MPRDLWYLFGGAMCSFIGWVGGALSLRILRDSKKPHPVALLCGCGHNRSYHRQDPKGGRACAYVGWSDPCECRQYSGPVPLPEYYAPEIGQ